MGCHFPLQGIFPTQGSNLRLLHWQVDSLPLIHQGSLSSSQNHLCFRIFRATNSICLQIERSFIINYIPPALQSVQFSSVAQSCPTLCDLMNRSTPGLPVHHQLPEPTQTRVHRVGDAIQPSHPLSFPSPPAPNPSQHQGLFK